MLNPQNFIVGTAGHIDHGKTTLVKALTGIDTDRWDEEKKRGITIDLGFAHYRDENGTQLAFIDAPGHEKFVHNMLAGAAGLDAVMLVVAADEGVMPQTREHLDICNFLGISSGIVVLTRCDLVEDPELIELCEEEVRELTTGTFLDSAPIHSVSAISGSGLDGLKNTLSQLCQKLQPRHYDKPFRSIIDRSFTIKGFGTVVTGTVLTGRWNKGDDLWQYPHHQPIRVRGLQVHGQATEQAEAGQRVAFNLAGLSKEDIQRGDQLASPHSLMNSYMLNVELSVLATIPFSLHRRDRVRLHLGTQEVIGRIIPLEQESIEPGDSQLAQLRLEKPVSGRFGDPLIIRQFSPVRTLGGGRIIDPAPSKSRRIRAELKKRLDLVRGQDKQQQIEQVIYLQATQGVWQKDLTSRSGLSEKQVRNILQNLLSQRRLLCIDPDGKRYLHIEHVNRMGKFVYRLVEMYHRNHPDREGVTRAELQGKLAPIVYNEREAEALLAYLVKLGKLILDQSYYHTPNHQKKFSQDQEQALVRLLELVEQGKYQPPRKTHLLEQSQLDEKEGMAILKIACHDRLLVRVASDLYYLPHQLDEIADKIQEYFCTHERLTVIDFKSELDISRKHAVDLLEYFDSQRVTIRIDNHRVLC